MTIELRTGYESQARHDVPAVGATQLAGAHSIIEEHFSVLVCFFKMDVIGLICIHRGDFGSCQIMGFDQPIAPSLNSSSTMAFAPMKRSAEFVPASISSNKTR